MPSILTSFMVAQAGPGLDTAALTDRLTGELWLAAGWALMTTPPDVAAPHFNRPARAPGGTGEQNVVRVH
jgi:hypothetical protein